MDENCIFSQKLEHGFNVVQSRLGGQSEKDAHDALQSLLASDAKMFETVSLGLLYGLLTDPANALKVRECARRRKRFTGENA